MPRCSDSLVVRRVDRIVLRPCIFLGLGIFRSGIRILLLGGQCLDGPVVVLIEEWNGICMR